MSNDNDTGRAESIAKIRELIEGIDFAMLTTIKEDGSLHCRPMSTQEVEFDGDLWFFTRASAHKVDEVAHDNRVNVAYSRPDEQKYLSVSGRAKLVRDRAKMEELWHTGLEAWFPEGLDDPDVALLKVDAESVEYWIGTSNAVAYTIGLAKALVTGEEYQPGENKSVKL